MKNTHRIFFIMAVTTSVVLTIRILTTEIPVLDRWAAPVVATNDHSWVFYLFRWITELGSGTFVTPLTIVVALIIGGAFKNWLGASLLGCGVFLGYRLNHWVKLMVQRERPWVFEDAEAVGFSFPSGHAMGAMVTYGLILYFCSIYLRSKRAVFWVKCLGIAIILLIGVSRYVIGVHYITDVAAGFAFGYLFLLSWIGLYRFILSVRVHEKDRI